jgi:hypothetical protein
MFSQPVGLTQKVEEILEKLITMLRETATQTLLKMLCVMNI